MAGRRAANDPAVRVELSPRQREVLALIAQGMTNGEIAERLGISLDGAKWHVREILSRLGMESREEAAAWWRDGGGKRRLRGWIWTPAPVFVAGGAIVAVAAIAFGTVVLVVLDSDPASPRGAEVHTTATVTPPVRTATPTGTAAPPTLVPTPAVDYAGIVLASGNVREDAATVLREGERVELTCHEAAAWERPTMAEMSERFTFYRFGNGEHPFPGLYAYHLADVLYQEMPWANSANIEFYSMSGLNGGNDGGRAAPGLCPPRAHSEDISTAPQAIFFAGLRPLAILELGGHAVVVVEADDGVLHKIAFERLICCAGKAGPFPFERLDVVTVDGKLRYVESGQERWQADAAGAVEFAVTSDVVGELPHDLPLPDPFVAYDAHDPGWQTIDLGFLPAGATVGSHAEDPERIEMRMLFLPAGSRIP